MRIAMKWILILAALFAYSQSHAFRPESGFWWNENESGRGYNIDIQDNQIWLSAFIYRPDGTPVWYLTSGALSANLKSYSGTLLALGGGQCAGCAYSAPYPIESLGEVTLTFDSATTATMTWGGGTTRIRRFAFGIDIDNPPKALFGEWAFIEGGVSFPVYYGERMMFTSTYTSGGITYATGYRSGSTANSAVGGQYTDGTWNVLIDSSTNYYRFYQFYWTGLNSFQGNMWIFEKSSSPSGNGTPFTAFRISGKNTIGFEVRQGEEYSARSSQDAFDQRDAYLASQSSQVVSKSQRQLTEVREQSAVLRQAIGSMP